MALIVLTDSSLIEVWADAQGFSLPGGQGVCCPPPGWGLIAGHPGKRPCNAVPVRYFVPLTFPALLREEQVQDVAEYRDRRWWGGDIPAHPACVVTPTGEEPWLRVSKAQVPAPPEVPALAPLRLSPRGGSFR